MGSNTALHVTFFRAQVGKKRIPPPSPFQVDEIVRHAIEAASKTIWREELHIHRDESPQREFRRIDPVSRH
jgi:hypothetical protein